MASPDCFDKSVRWLLVREGVQFNADGSVKSASGERTDLMSSVAYWYQTEPHAPFPVLPDREALLPPLPDSYPEAREAFLGAVRVGMLPELRHRAAHAHLVAFALQYHAQRAPDILLVIHDQDAFGYH